VRRNIFATTGHAFFARRVKRKPGCPSWFTPTKLGRYRMFHRVVLAPLTRMRSDPGDFPSDLIVENSTPRSRPPDRLRGGADNGGSLVIDTACVRAA
jgi:N-ethylmaleimide reductase